MSTLMDIIEEENQRLEKLIIFYENEIHKFPKGYISKKKVKGHIYFYHSFRQGKKVKNIYLGKESDKVEGIKIKIVERKKLEALLRQTKENLKEAKRALRAKQ